MQALLRLMHDFRARLVSRNAAPRLNLGAGMPLAHKRSRLDLGHFSRSALVLDLLEFTRELG
jgi:hypothetical protein